MAVWAFDNDAQSVTLNAVTATQVTLPVESSAAFAGLTTSGMQSVVRIDDSGSGGVPGKYEFVLCNGNDTDSNTLAVSSRGYAGTTATSFQPGATVTEVMTKETFNGAFARIDTATEFGANVTIDGNVSVGGTLAVTGDSTLTGDATFNGQVIANSFVAMNVQIGDFNGGGALFVGTKTTPGPPTSTSITFEPGNWGFDSNGTIWYCIAAGAPGTWRVAGGGIYCDAHVGTAAALSTTAATTVPFNAVDADTAGGFNTSGHYYATPIVGRYLVNVAVNLVASTGGALSTAWSNTSIHLNNSSYAGITGIWGSGYNAQGDINTYNGTVVVRSATVGDQISYVFDQSQQAASPGPPVVATTSRMSVQYLGPL